MWSLGDGRTGLFRTVGWLETADLCPRCSPRNDSLIRRQPSSSRAKDYAAAQSIHPQCGGQAHSADSPIQLPAPRGRRNSGRSDSINDATLGPYRSRGDLYNGRYAWSTTKSNRRAIPLPRCLCYNSFRPGGRGRDHRDDAPSVTDGFGQAEEGHDATVAPSRLAASCVTAATGGASPRSKLATQPRTSDGSIGRDPISVGATTRRTRHGRRNSARSDLVSPADDVFVDEVLLLLVLPLDESNGVIPAAAIRKNDYLWQVPPKVRIFSPSNTVIRIPQFTKQAIGKIIEQALGESIISRLFLTQQIRYFERYIAKASAAEKGVPLGATYIQICGNIRAEWPGFCDGPSSGFAESA